EGDVVEILTPGRPGIPFVASALSDEEGNSLSAAPHPGMRFFLSVPVPVAEGDLLRGGERQE
ncbi:MAG: U32 family peptidase C-terminal domain-containing protein, partial [Clostridia bacterium]|nr:U32 family peptidase C-terminal domain-containing protein [Clostridia bacterium]